MNRTIILFLLSVTAVCFEAGAAEAEKPIIICGEDVSDPDNFYRFENFRNNISLLPNDGSNAAAYEAIYKIYTNRLTQEQESLDSVENFLFMLEEIVAGLTSTDLTVESEQGYEDIISDERSSAKILCAEMEQDKRAIQDIGYIVHAMQRIYDEGWFSLSQEVDRSVKLLSLRYDQWLENGIDIWPHEYYLNVQLVEGRRKPSSSNRSYFRKHQYTFLRPYVGFGGEVNTNEGDIVKLALAVDIIGVVKYTRRDYSSHWGLSLAVIAPEDQETSLGILYRKNNFAIGVSANNDGDKSVFLGVDILKLINADLPYVGRIRVDAASSPLRD